MCVRVQAVVGVVYNFVMGQMYAAKKGGGATMNGKPIQVSSCTGRSLPHTHTQYPSHHLTP